jgi:hypothetical protein
MKIGLLIIGVLLILVGGTFFFQGIGVLQGSRMTGDIFWAWVGLFLLVVGGAATFLGWRGRRVP